MFSCCCRSRRPRRAALALLGFALLFSSLRSQRLCVIFSSPIRCSPVLFTSSFHFASLSSSGALLPSLVQPSGKEPTMSTRAARKTNHSSGESQTKSPIRIVPLHPHVRDAAAPAPHLTYLNGPLLTSLAVFTLFCCTAWHDAANAQL